MVCLYLCVFTQVEAVNGVSVPVCVYTSGSSKWCLYLCVYTSGSNKWCFCLYLCATTMVVLLIVTLFNDA